MENKKFETRLAEILNEQEVTRYGTITNAQEIFKNLCTLYKETKLELPNDKEIEELFLKKKGFLSFQYKMEAWKEIKNYLLTPKNNGQA